MNLKHLGWSSQPDRVKAEAMESSWWIGEKKIRFVQNSSRGEPDRGVPRTISPATRVKKIVSSIPSKH